MNSRDAAFDESLKEIIEATAAEAAAVQEANVDPVSVVHQPEANDASKKKRKRSEDDMWVFTTSLKIVIHISLAIPKSELDQPPQLQIIRAMHRQ